MITHSGYDGLYLKLTREQNEQFIKDQILLYLKYYAEYRKTHKTLPPRNGSIQFGKSLKECEALDFQTMEELYQKYKDEL